MVNSLHFHSNNTSMKSGPQLPPRTPTQSQIVAPGTRWIAVLLLVVCLLLSLDIQAAELTAEVDRETVIDGETVVLYIKGTDVPNLPDTSSLNANFRIIQSGQSSSQTIVNGQRSRSITARLELQPKSLGSSVIPAFTVAGVSSDPVTIEVVSRGTPGVEPRDKVFAELSVDNPNPYVQEQVILSLKIFDDGNLASADPVLNGTSEYQIEKLPLGREKIVERNGVQYRQNTFRYALFPQQSGDITIEPVTIPASIRDNSYSGNLILFNTPTRRIELRSDSISVSVKPRSSASTSGWWLPVKSLELKHEWSADISNAKVGEPLTLTLETIANGATSTQLPEIPVPDVPGLKIYVDNPEFGSRPDESGLLSVRREKWSVIPNQGGQLTLPEVVVKWWDAEAGVEQQAVIPAQQLTIAGQGSDVNPAPAANLVADAESTSQSLDSVADGSITTEQQRAEPVNDSLAIAGNQEDSENVRALSARSLKSGELVPRHWLWLAFAAITVWLFTLFAWWWSVIKRSSTDATTTPAGNLMSVDKSSERRAFNKMNSLAKASATAGDTSAYSNAVLEWAQCRWPQSPVHNLPEIGIRLNDRTLTEEMQRLDKQRFSSIEGTVAPVSIKNIQKTLEYALGNEPSDDPVHNPHALPEL